MFSINSLPKSSFIESFRFTGPRKPYPDKDIMGDTYPITWADDDNLYTSAGDPQWGETTDGLDVEKIEGPADNYVITKASHMNDFTGFGGDGAKPTGMICVDGILYLAAQNLRGMQMPAFKQNSQHGSDASILYSYNKGFLWTPTYSAIKEPMFPGSKFGGPAFINFGKNNENARDEYVYAVSGDQWDNGSNVRLGRVKADSIMRKECWEWVCAYDADGQPVFYHSLDQSIPILSIHSCIGAPEMVYIKGINRYLFLTWRLHKDFSCVDGADLIILEAPEPWGPFSLVHIEHDWEDKLFNPYCPRIPLKWMSEDGLSGHLLFSGSWSGYGRENYYYRANTRAFELKLK